MDQDYETQSVIFTRLSKFQTTVKEYFDRSNNKTSSTRTFGFFSLIVLGLLSLWYLPLQEWWLNFLQWMSTLGDSAFIVYLLVFIVATVLCFPVGLLTIASGFMFGLWIGTFVSWVGSVIGACFAFFLGKKLFRSCIEEFSSTYPHFSTLDKAISQNAWKIVFLVRVSPLLPFNVLNYLLSLTNINFVDYTTATCVGLLPPTILWVYLGSIAKDLNELISNPTNSGTTVLVFGIFFTLLSLIFITQISAKIIKREFELSKTTATVV